MKLVVKNTARKALKRIQPKAAHAIMGDMLEIAADPFARHPQAKALAGLPGMYRLRHGDWRAVYRVDRERQTVFLEDVRKREEAYR